MSNLQPEPPEKRPDESRDRVRRSLTRAIDRACSRLITSATSRSRRGGAFHFAEVWKTMSRSAKRRIVEEVIALSPEPLFRTEPAPSPGPEPGEGRAAAPLAPVPLTSAPLPIEPSREETDKKKAKAEKKLKKAARKKEKKARKKAKKEAKRAKKENVEKEPRGEDDGVLMPPAIEGSTDS